MTALAEVACWPTTGGEHVTAGEVFAAEHQLTPYRLVLAESVRDHRALLEAVGIAAAPGAADGSEVLLEISSAAGDEPIDRTAQRVVRECWRLLQAPEAELDALDGERVVLGRSGVLYETEHVLINDVPTVAERFNDATHDRLIPAATSATRWRALVSSGSRTVSSHAWSTTVRRWRTTTSNGASTPDSSTWPGSPAARTSGGRRCSSSRAGCGSRPTSTSPCATRSRTSTPRPRSPRQFRRTTSGAAPLACRARTRSHRLGSGLALHSRRPVPARCVAGDRARRPKRAGNR